MSRYAELCNAHTCINTFLKQHGVIEKFTQEEINFLRNYQAQGTSDKDLLKTISALQILKDNPKYKLNEYGITTHVGFYYGIGHGSFNQEKHQAVNKFVQEYKELITQWQKKIEENQKNYSSIQSLIDQNKNLINQSTSLKSTLNAVINKLKEEGYTINNLQELSNLSVIKCLTQGFHIKGTKDGQTVEYKHIPSTIPNQKNPTRYLHVEDKNPLTCNNLQQSFQKTIHTIIQNLSTEALAPIVLQTQKSGRGTGSPVQKVNTNSQIKKINKQTLII